MVSVNRAHVWYVHFFLVRRAERGRGAKGSSLGLVERRARSVVKLSGGRGGRGGLLGGCGHPDIVYGIVLGRHGKGAAVDTGCARDLAGRHGRRQGAGAA